MRKKLQTLAEAQKVLAAGTPPPEDAGFLGADLDPEEAALVLLPVPWEVTTSYGGGTSNGPAAILQASHQLDMEDGCFGRPYMAGMAFLPEDSTIREWNKELKPLAEKVIEAVSQGKKSGTETSRINEAGKCLNEKIFAEAQRWRKKNKFVAVVGGDHASPQGLIEALDAEGEPFGILHFDAHHDLRCAYEGFEYSHASIFYNVMQSCKNVTKLVQVGIRDYSAEEKDYMESLGQRGFTFYSRDLFRIKASGAPFAQVTEDMLNQLPQQIYVSFDIDGLDPALCPSTGTPVPGGLSFEEASYILEMLTTHGKKIIGFDLCEVAPSPSGDEWDANVGARMLYKLCGALLKSQKLC